MLVLVLMAASGHAAARSPGIHRGRAGAGSDDDDEPLPVVLDGWVGTDETMHQIELKCTSM